MKRRLKYEPLLLILCAAFLLAMLVIFLFRTRPTGLWRAETQRAAPAESAETS